MLANRMLMGSSGTNSAVGWNLATAAYASVSFSHTAQTGAAIVAGCFSSDGTKMYIADYGSDKVWLYTLSTPWDLTSAAYASKFLYVGGQNASVHGMWFKPDGTSLYIAGNSGTDTVYQYDLLVAWDVTTATYVGSVSVNSQTTVVYGVQFNGTGTVMYVADVGTNTIYQYAVSTPWGVTTASYASKSFTPSQPAHVYGMFMRDDGAMLYIQDDTKIWQYAITGGDVTTATYTSKSFSVSSQTTAAEQIFISNTGTKLYVFGKEPNQRVYQYSMGA